MPFIASFVLHDPLSPEIIKFLYPKNYYEAGWMLQILAAAACFKSITTTIGPILFAAGNSFRAMLLIISVSIILVLSITVEGYLFGTKGVIWAIPTAEILNYPILIAAVRPYGVWFPFLDLSGFALTILVILAAGIL